jgi:N-acetyl-anhydromuramyl-L-alanine amidase AmpD
MFRFTALLLLSHLLFSVAYCGPDKQVSMYVKQGFCVPAKERKVEAIIIHSVYNANSADPFSIYGILKEFSHYGVSAHYLIGRDGSVYNLVKEENISYHAGQSILPDGSRNVNSKSIGIEVVTNLNSSPTEAQYQALAILVQEIKMRHNIKYILGHSDIARERKSDPWNFDWQKLRSLAVPALTKL